MLVKKRLPILQSLLFLLNSCSVCTSDLKQVILSKNLFTNNNTISTSSFNKTIREWCLEKKKEFNWKVVRNVLWKLIGRILRRAMNLGEKILYTDNHQFHKPNHHHYICPNNYGHENFCRIPGANYKKICDWKSCTNLFAPLQSPISTQDLPQVPNSKSYPQRDLVDLTLI